MQQAAEIDPRLNDAQARLGTLIQQLVGGKPCDIYMANKVERLVKDFHITCRLKGIDFPKCVVLAFPKLGQIVVWPKDASFFDVQVRMRMLIHQMRRHDKEIDPEEMASAVRKAYPDYGKPIQGTLESFLAAKPETLQ